MNRSQRPSPFEVGVVGGTVTEASDSVGTGQEKMSTVRLTPRRVWWSFPSFVGVSANLRS